MEIFCYFVVLLKTNSRSYLVRFQFCFGDVCVFVLYKYLVILLRNESYVFRFVLFSVARKSARRDKRQGEDTVAGKKKRQKTKERENESESGGGEAKTKAKNENKGMNRLHFILTIKIRVTSTGTVAM